MRRIYLSLSLSLFFLAESALCAGAATDALINIDSLPESRVFDLHLEPGKVVILPDGRKAKIELRLPDGDYKSSLGDIISPAGVLRNGSDAGKAVIPDSAVENETNIVEPQPRKDENKEIPVAGPASPKVDEPAKTVPPKAPGSPKAPQAKTASEKELTLAGMLPLTPITTENEVKTQHKEQHQAKPGASKKATPEKEPAKKTAKAHKAKPGEALRIPEEAVKSGNLDFLEGCWQGTRPEYFTKRTVRECFCFGANGKNGKRRILDGTYGRQCIGATSATLSANGVLSVTSQGAYCNDGERWGSAEMVCRNSGPRTPCSWVFRDANNGRQSYEIPFVRVESCGR